MHPKKLLNLVPWGVVHDLSWGMFGSIPVVRDRLGPKWGGESIHPGMGKGLHGGPHQSSKQDLQHMEAYSKISYISISIVFAWRSVLAWGLVNFAIDAKP